MERQEHIMAQETVTQAELQPKSNSPRDLALRSFKEKKGGSPVKSQKL